MNMKHTKLVSYLTVAFACFTTGLLLGQRVERARALRVTRCVHQWSPWVVDTNVPTIHVVQIPGQRHHCTNCGWTDYQWE